MRMQRKRFSNEVAMRLSFGKILRRFFIFSLMFFCLSIWIIITALDTQLNSADNTRKHSKPYNNIPHHSSHDRLQLTAYLEEAMTDNWQYSRPLKRRSDTKLHKHVYPQVSSCKDIPNHWPVDHPMHQDDIFGSNVGHLESLYERRAEYVKHCPVDADPFLPWIHDVFVDQSPNTGIKDSNDDKSEYHVYFVAHNKRRCRTAPSFRDTDMKNLEPQVALFQSVSIKQLNASERESLLSKDERATNTTRYRLASRADADILETRFLCQFHTQDLCQDQFSSKKHVLGETWSVFPYNYEHLNGRKGAKAHPLLTRPKDDQDVHGAHNEQIWNSILTFSCPLSPDAEQYLKEGSQDSDLYLDLVPIRTPPREVTTYSPRLETKSTFDPEKEWGDEHVLPTVEKSGRWANIPLCNLKHKARSAEPAPTQEIEARAVPQKHHTLVGCVWASAVFKTRGQSASWDKSTSTRLIEWLTYHLEVAKFDHIYVYDNTEAFSNEDTLETITKHFPERVTHIPWKFRVCNNNPPAHRNAGERSSQYAAETSCRLRYGPETEWMSFFDVDEYFIPQGNWSDVASWLRNSVVSGRIQPETNILSFFQTRALPRADKMIPFVEENGTGLCSEAAEKACLVKPSKKTFLEVYDCESTPLPKPDFGWRAKKQIFRPSYVLGHFVHYTTVTRRVNEFPLEKSPLFTQRYPFERRVDELTEAFMLHTKTTDPSTTAGWQSRCKNPFETKKCPVGISHPPKQHSIATQSVPESRLESYTNHSGLQSIDGYVYNCYPHDRIQNEFVGQLENFLSLN